MSATPARGAGARKRNAADIAKNAVVEQRDVRTKLSDFSRFMDEVVAENEVTKQELAATKARLIESTEQCRIATEAKDAEAAKYTEELKRHMSDYESTIEKLNEEKEELQRRITNAAQETAELNGLRLTVTTIKSHLKDYITLGCSGVPLITTTGQITSIEGIIGQWLNSPMFNGDVNFKFVCPMTRQITSLLMDEGIIKFLQRVGSSFNAPLTVPPFYFRHSRYDAEDEMDAADIMDWCIYTIPEQLSLMAKIAFNYQHRETEPSFSMMLKENHLVTMSCKKIASVDPANPSVKYRFLMALNLLTSYSRTHNRAPHALDFVLTLGTQNPFPECDFKWVSPEVVLAGHLP